MNSPWKRCRKLTNQSVSLFTTELFRNNGEKCLSRLNLRPDLCCHCSSTVFCPCLSPVCRAIPCLLLARPVTIETLTPRQDVARCSRSHPCVPTSLWDVSYVSLDVQKDDLYTGRGRIEQRRRDLRLPHCKHVAAQHAEFTSESFYEHEAWVELYANNATLMLSNFPVHDVLKWNPWFGCVGRPAPSTRSIGTNRLNLETSWAIRNVPLPTRPEDVASCTATLVLDVDHVLALLRVMMSVGRAKQWRN